MMLYDDADDVMHACSSQRERREFMVMPKKHSTMSGKFSCDGVS